MSRRRIVLAHRWRYFAVVTPFCAVGVFWPGSTIGPVVIPVALLINAAWPKRIAPEGPMKRRLRALHGRHPFPFKRGADRTPIGK